MHFAFTIKLLTCLCIINARLYRQDESNTWHRKSKKGAKRETKTREARTQAEKRSSHTMLFFWNTDIPLLVFVSNSQSVFSQVLLLPVFACPFYLWMKLYLLLIRFSFDIYPTAHKETKGKRTNETQQTNALEHYAVAAVLCLFNNSFCCNCFTGRELNKSSIWHPPSKQKRRSVIWWQIKFFFGYCVHTVFGLPAKSSPVCVFSGQLAAFLLRCHLAVDCPFSFFFGCIFAFVSLCSCIFHLHKTFRTNKTSHNCSVALSLSVICLGLTFLPMSNRRRWSMVCMSQYAQFSCLLHD